MCTKAIEKVEETGQAGFELAQRQAKVWAASDLVPQQFKGNIANVMIAMDAASQMGAGILQTMQNMYIVHGKPAWSSTFLIACVNASGKFTPIRFRMVGEPGKADRGCIAYACDKESGEECEGPLVNIEMAKAEGWYTKNGSKWKTMPELMLRYRAAAFWSRLFAPEISLGFHTVDELEDIKTKTVETVVLGAAENPLDKLADNLVENLVDENE